MGLCKVLARRFKAHLAGMMDAMSDNPFDPPANLVPPPQPARSIRVYVIASIVTITLFLIFIVAPLGVSLERRGIRIDIPGETVSTSPSGDPVVTHQHYVITSVFGVSLMAAILLGIALTVVNGSIALIRLFWRSGNLRE